MKILLVDDEPLELFISKKFLSQEFEVQGFNSINDAIGWAQSNSFDILVSDYFLGGNKYASDLLKDLKSQYQNNFKAYVLTNHLDDEKKQELISAGFLAVIEKPITLEKFKQETGI